MKTWHMLACICFFVASCAGPDFKSSPLVSTEISRSPTGAYVAYALEGRSDQDARKLIIEAKRDRTIIFSLPIQRHVELTWSPEDRAVGVLDHFASNENQILIVNLISRRLLLKVSRDNLSKWNESVPSGLEYSHVQFSELRWVSPKTLRASIEMYNPISARTAKSYAGVIEIALESKLR